MAGLVNQTMVKDKEIYKEIMNLFDICIKSQTVQQSLFDAVRDQISSNEISKKDEEKPGFKDFERSIEKMARSFNENFKNFRKMLVSSNKNQLKFLAFRLDFNEYYEYQDFYS